MTQEELREAVLAALLDYETLKKTRRLKAVKKALQGTMVATMIGSTGLMAANQGRSNQARETAFIMASNPNAMSTKTKLPLETNRHDFIPGVAQFAFDRHTLTPAHIERLMELIHQLPKDAELTVIGHTDSHGQAYYNKKLGKQRARAVASYLAEHGIKIKAIDSEISKNMREAWMARRVDIIVDSAAPLATHLPPLVKQRPQQETEYQAKWQMPSQAIDYSGYNQKVKKELQEKDKVTGIGNTKFTEVNSNSDGLTEKSKPGQQALQLQQIRGVTHFAFNKHTLVTAHKERLMELVKQLPKDAELTVIGRTEAIGADEYNKALGKLRAKAVANFLANQGVKIKAIGSKVSSDRFTGWMARRVDIVVESARAPVAINLPAPVIQMPTQSVEAHTKSPTQAISSKVGKRAVVIENDISRIIDRARYIYNVNH